MNYLLLVLLVLACALQSVFQGKFADRVKGGAFFFTALFSACAAVFFLIAFRDDRYYGTELLPYSVCFAVGYSVGVVANVLALKYGPLGTTSLIISLSLLLPTVWGLIVWHESFRVTMAVGTAFLVAALVLVNTSKNGTGEKTEKNRISWKWVTSVTLAFFGNAACTISQKSKQVDCGEEGNALFMVVALLLTSVLMLISTAVLKSEREKVKAVIGKGWYYAIACGICNGLVNFTVIKLNPVFPASLLFPVVSGGTIILIFLYSLFFRHEQYSRKQKIGFLCGVISVVLLNL